MQAKALRIILGAVKTTHCSVTCRVIRNGIIYKTTKIGYGILDKLQGQKDNHPVREVLHDCWEILSATGKGFVWKIKGWVNEHGLD